MRLNSKTNIHRQTKHQSVTRLKLTVFILTSGGLMLGLLCPYTITDQSVSAESSVSNVSQTRISADEVIAVTAPSEVVIDVTPDFQNDTFATGTANVSVATNNLYGYTLAMGTSSTDADDNLTTSLINSVNDNYSIPTLEGGHTEADFPTNSWGYTTDPINETTTYHPLATFDNATVIRETDAPATSSSTAVTFAAKIDSATTAGDYHNTVTFSAVANPGPPTLDNPAVAKYMQDMTTEMCANTPTFEQSGKTYNLIDKRDGKSYAVRKLKDNNCWMVQNLALDGGASVSPLNTDISSTSTFTTLPSSASWTTDETTPHMLNGDTSITDWREEYGNYYNWATATAGTGHNTSAPQDAPSSICPLNWQLPSKDGGRSFTNLIRAYDITKGDADTVATLQAVPISLTPAGSLRFREGGIVRSVNEAGYYWESTANSQELHTFGFYFKPSDFTIASQTEVLTSWGYSIRCVAR